MEDKLIKETRKIINEHIALRERLLIKENNLATLPTNTKEIHINGIKKFLEENRDLLEDRSSYYGEKEITIPRKREEIFNNLIKENLIKEPDNIYLFAYALCMCKTNNRFKQNYFEPQLVKCNNIYDENIVDIVLVNFEDPNLQTFIRPTGLDRFSQNNIILIPKIKSISNKLAWFRYMNELIENGKDAAYLVLNEYFDFYNKNKQLKREH